MFPLVFHISSLITFLLVNGSVVAAASSGIPYPTIVDVVFHYHPNIAVSAVAAGLYLSASCALFFCVFKGKAWWGLCLPIGAACEGIGFILRIMVTRSPNSIPLFINMQIFIACSPAAFLAFNYILHGRLIRMCIGAEHSLIRPEIISTLFIFSDTITFIIQSAGASIETKHSLANVGQKIWLIGVILQAASYFLFCLLVVRAHWSITKDQKITGEEPWWTVLWTIYFSSFFIVIRCIYRLIEVVQGNKGVLTTREIYIYLLDALPLIFAISVYIPFWPTRFFSTVHNGSFVSESLETNELEVQAALL